MHRVYEIFEVPPNGLPQRVTVVSGLESAKSKLHEIADHTNNECFAADARTRQIVALVNVPPSKWRATKHIFQITYDEELGRERAELLKSHGYNVLSVISNESAKVALSPIQHHDLFIVGHAAPEETRQEIVLWLKEKFPNVKVLVLNPPDQQLPSADYNVRQNGPNHWLPLILRELPNSNPEPAKASTGGGK